MIVAVAVCGFRLFPKTDVTVLSNGQTYQVSTVFDPAREGLDAADIALQPGDLVRYAGNDKFASIAIQHARPVRIEADGIIIELRTHASTIEGALADAGVALQPEDRVYLDNHLATSRGPLEAIVAASSRAIAPSGVTNESGAVARQQVSLEVVRARPLTFVIDSVATEVKSSAPNVEAFLADMGMTVREGDLVSPPLESELFAGMTVRLANAKTVSVTIDGKPQQLYTQARTVADIFQLLGITIGAEDVVSVPLDTPVNNGMAVSLGRTIVSDEDVLEPLEPATRYEQDPALPFGQSRTVAGVPGQVKTKYRITYKGGVEQERVAISDGEVVVAPVPTRIIQGTRSSPGPSQPPAAVSAPSNGGSGYTPPPVENTGGAGGRQVNVWATWYNETHGGKDRSDPGYGITKSGAVLQKGICATDPNYIPLGTMMYVPGYGSCVAGDIGGGVRGWHIDLGFPEAGGIPDWGERNVTITIFD